MLEARIEYHSLFHFSCQSSGSTSTKHKPLHEPTNVHFGGMHQAVVDLFGVPVGGVCEQNQGPVLAGQDNRKEMEYDLCQAYRNWLFSCATSVAKDAMAPFSSL